MQSPYDFESMSLSAAVKLAVALSGRSDDDIIARAGWSPSVGRRVLNMTDNYWPSLPNVVPFCRAVGNTVLVQWLEAQAGSLVMTRATPMSAVGMVLCMGELFESMGELATAGGTAVANGDIDAGEARALLRKLRSVMARAARMLAQLEATAQTEGEHHA